MRKPLLAGIVLFLSFSSVFSQGKLFIIGGGDRAPALMATMIREAGLGPTDYIAVLPMSSGEPDTSFFYFKKSIDVIGKYTIVNLAFNSGNVGSRSRLDSLEKSKLVFITGGDQSRFMKLVLNTPVYASIHKAYANGAMIAGTSAGAAVMSEHMVTGRQLRGDSVVRETISSLRAENIEFKPGLALLTNAVIDQHFIKRSRYNRMLSALQAYPKLACIGIDEATAIVVSGKNVKVEGVGQVIMFADPVGADVTEAGLIKYRDIRLSVFTAGDSFTLP
ncbi:MAG: cyanophycinase [Chitinophagaceae bacterium]|nr:MAG: cyanophycinase [Chitinophagaceae bacterium]